jgi:hypothetical protein
MSIEGSGHVIAYFALQHLKAATTFRDYVVAIESHNYRQPYGDFFEEIRSYTSACISSATTSLEALINEFFISPQGPLRKMLRNFDKEFWGYGGIESMPPLEKYQKALEMLNRQKLDEHTLLFRNARTLLKLHNTLIHYKTTMIIDNKCKLNLMKALSGKFELSPFTNSSADFVTMKIMSAGCVKWALSVVLSFMREFATRAHLDEKKMSAFWRVGTY